MYDLEFTRQAEKDIRKLNNPVLEKVILAIDNLREEPRPVGCKKLQGEDDLWRIRIGRYRVIYSVADEIEVVTINRARHRKDVYRK